MRLWRISNYRSLSGEGGRLFAARWHTAGRRIVYLATSPASALLEILVHLEVSEQDVPQTYNLLTIEAPDELLSRSLAVIDQAEWRLDLAFTQSLGDQWLAGGASAMMLVPSAILPQTDNVLLNPEHEDAARVLLLDSEQVAFDARLLPTMRTR